MKHYADAEWSALLKAVVDSPADDLPRLVAADWLEEHGDPERAEFIRLQCAAESDASPTLAWKIRTLANSLTGRLWAVEACPNLVTLAFAEGGPTLTALSVQRSERVQFRRGFPDSVVCPAVEWLAHGTGTVPRQPLARVRLLLAFDVPIERWWAMLPTLRQLEIVEIRGYRSELLEFLRKNLPGVEVLG